MFLLLVAPAFGKSIKSNFINLNNRVRIHYYDNNNGSNVILFVHGLPLNADSWRPQLENFQKKYRVIALDLPGYGLSTSLPTPIPAELSAWYANVISHFLKKTGRKECCLHWVRVSRTHWDEIQRYLS